MTTAPANIFLLETSPRLDRKGLGMIIYHLSERSTLKSPGDSTFYHPCRLISGNINLKSDIIVNQNPCKLIADYNYISGADGP